MLRIDRIMKEKGVSTHQLAEIMGVTPQYVSEVVNERKNITLAQLSKFADALNVSMSALLDGYPNNVQMGMSSFNCPLCGGVIRVEKG